MNDPTLKISSKNSKLGTFVTSCLIWKSVAKLGQCCFLMIFFLTDNIVNLSQILTFYFYTSIEASVPFTTDNLLNAIGWFGLKGTEANNTRESLDETTGQIVLTDNCIREISHLFPGFGGRK